MKEQGEGAGAGGGPQYSTRVLSSVHIEHVKKKPRKLVSRKSLKDLITNISIQHTYVHTYIEKSI